MPRSFSFLALSALALALAGCGLTLDPSEDDAGGRPTRDADLTRRDAGPPMDGDLPLDAGLSPDASLSSDAGGPSCPDEDGDGYTPCDGDCDDGDPTRYPGAPPICGDAIAQDCVSVGDDEVCGGFGTYVSETTGDDANPGTQAEPLETIAAGIAAAQRIVPGALLDVYVAEGLYDENIDVVEGVSLIGGFDPASWARDPQSYESELRATRHAGTLVPAGVTRATAIDGMVLTSLAATSASTLTIEANASPTVAGCRVEGPNTSGHSRAIDVNPTQVVSSGRPSIVGCEIQNGDARDGWGADTGGWGILVAESDVEIADVDVLLSDDNSHQRGIILRDAPSTASVSKARVTAEGRATVAEGIVVQGGGGQVDQSFVDPGGCQNGCAGIGLFRPQATTRVTNSVAFGGEGGGQRGTGLLVSMEGGVGTNPDIVVSSNFFMGTRGSVTRGSAGATLAIFDPSPVTVTLAVGRFTNNIFFSGTATPTIAFEEQTNQYVEPQLFHNNALYSLTGQPAVYLDDRLGPVALSALGSTGIYASNLNDSCGVDWTTVPPFVLATGSTCEDMGTTVDMPPADQDGDPRPNGTAPEIGPDEI